MKNIHILETDKPSRLYEFGGNYHISVFPQENFRSKNLYITCDESIKEDDWLYNIQSNKIRKCFSVDRNRLVYTENDKKIILTTDADLIENGVQEIDDNFLEWFIQNSTCENIEIEKQMLCENCGQEYCDNLRCKGYKDSALYEIIIPKEEQELLPNFTISQDIFNRIADLKNEKKEEVLRFPFVIENSLEYLKLTQRIFDNGVRWQEELNNKKFSEEEVLALFEKFDMHLPLHYEFLIKEELKKMKQ